jgi:sulfide:quinone oxidoreductase
MPESRRRGNWRSSIQLHTFLPLFVRAHIMTDVHTPPHRIVIIGGGAAGITVATELKHHAHEVPLHITIIEPSEHHYYQPAFTLVGAGAYTLAATRRAEKKLIPRDVAWIKDFATSIDPDRKHVHLPLGRTFPYDVLVVCPGLQCNWDGIAGLRDALGRDGVCSNYSSDTVEYTWECLRGLKPGAKAVFTQPAMPIKCPGAPQKIAYLASDYLRKSGIRHLCDVSFYTQTPSIFGVPLYAKELVKIAAAHKIDVNYQHNLVSIDAAARKATFEVTGENQANRSVTCDYDMLHVTPPQGPPDFLKGSPIANAGGFVEVNANTLQHPRHPEVFGLGDAAGTTNSKTAAAVRKQAPVVARNILRLLRGESAEAAYDGYAACPLTTAYGKVLMAEFIYGGKPTPTLPLDPRKEGRINWLIKKYGLPLLYWDYMLKGREAFPSHNTHYVEPA